MRRDAIATSALAMSMTHVATPLYAFCMMGMGNCASQNAAAAMRAFGIVGTWAVDCAAGPGGRIKFTVSPPRVTATARTLGGVVPLVFIMKVTMARRITSDKLRMKFLTSVVEAWHGHHYRKAANWPETAVAVVYLKEHGRIRVWDETVTKNGKAQVLFNEGAKSGSISQSPDYERCLN